MIGFFTLILDVLIFVLAVYGAQRFYERYRRLRRRTYVNDSSRDDNWTSEPQTPEEIEEFWRAFAENESTALGVDGWGNHTDHDDAMPEDVVKPRKRTNKKTTTKKPRSAKE